MKTKNVFYTAIAVSFLSLNLTAQNQANLADTTGSITVNGRMRVDSSITARDSALFEKKLRVKGDVIIHGKTFMRDNGVANQNFRVQNGFRVDGISRFYNNVFADSTLRVGNLGLFENNVRVNGQLRTYGINNLFGVSRFHDEIRLLNLDDPTGQNNEGMMMLSGNGKVLRKDIITADSLASGDYLLLMGANGEMKRFGAAQMQLSSEACVSLGPVGGPTPPAPTPVWANKPGILWTGHPCNAFVGIGTSNPVTELHIAGRQLIGGVDSNLVQPGQNLTSARLNIAYSKNSNIDAFQVHARDYSAGTYEKVFSVKMDGVVYATEVRVRPTSAIPDYVFAKDYNLMPLSELQLFIDKNHHLPNIPSAKEVEEKGAVDLGEMNNKLLEKVEELTLYILEQEERIQKLEERLDEQEQKGGQ